MFLWGKLSLLWHARIRQVQGRLYAVKQSISNTQNNSQNIWGGLGTRGGSVGKCELGTQLKTKKTACQRDTGEITLFFKTYYKREKYANKKQLFPKEWRGLIWVLIILFKTGI